MKTRPDRIKLMSFSESVATNLLEPGVKTHAAKLAISLCNSNAGSNSSILGASSAITYKVYSCSGDTMEDSA